MKMKIAIPVIVTLTLLLSAIAVFALDQKNSSEVPQQVLDMVENRRIVHSLTKEQYTIGEKGFRMHYINDVDLEKSYKSVKDLMTEEEQWLYIIEYKDDSHISMLIGKHQGKYDVLMHGGGAEMFYHTLKLADSSNFSTPDLLSYAGHYYLINSKSQVFQIPGTRKDYERNPELFDTPISEEDCLKLILENYTRYQNQDMSDFKPGSGLIQQHQDEKN